MIIRTYRCDDCREIFDVTCESNDPDPDCPYCSQVLTWQPERFAIGTVKGKAVDLTQQIMEQDYGLSNFNDSQREGDVAAKTPVRTTAAREAIEKLENDAKNLQLTAANMVPQAKEFFSGAHPLQVNIAQAALADARANKGESNAIELLHKAGKRGEMGTNYRLLTDTGRTITVRK